jgi:tRNA 2-thiouridine synthesizing protein C
MIKKYLFVLRKPAYCGLYIQETIDIILTTAAFDQQISLLFLDEAVFHLKTNQQPQLTEKKQVSALFNALEVFDINAIFLEAESLARYGLRPEDCGIPTKVISQADVADLIKHHNIVFSC